MSGPRPVEIVSIGNRDIHCQTVELSLAAPNESSREVLGLM